MPTIVRCFAEYRSFWRVWVPMIVLAAGTVPVFLSMPLVQKHLVDEVLLGRRFDQLPQTVALYAGLYVLLVSLNMALGFVRTYLDERLMVHIRHRLFAHYHALSLPFSRREHSGQVMALFLNDAGALAGFFGGAMVSWTTSILLLVVGAAMMFGLNWQLAMVGGVVPPLVAGLGWLVTRPLRRVSRRVQDKAAELNERLQESLAGIREVVLFGREDAQGRRFARTLNELLRLRLRVSLVDSAISSGQGLFGLVVTVVVMGYGGYLVLQDQTTLGTLIAMQALFDRLIAPARQIFGLASGAQKALASADRIYAFLDERPQVREQVGAAQPANVVGAVRFDRVSFGYQPERPVLTEVSFTVEAGRTVAIVGPSGAGKSTLASLIPRVYDPTEGRVLLDGRDVRGWTLAALRGQIGVVFQDTFLFAGTVRENIALGLAEAGDAEIIRAARLAQAWEFIERLPDGLETLVGERGVRLSEGQKQRLGIARALVRDPRILILDEPSSALDARSEHLLQSALDQAMHGRTTLIIAHRLATVRRADEILVLDAGRIAEQGTHAELYDRRGLYRELVDLQFENRGAPKAEGRRTSGALLSAV
jgi:ATP-binding cassette, subfamily B, bacterial MsbA